MIRKAEAGDLEALVAIGTEFGVKSQHVHGLTVSSDKIRSTLYQALVHGGSFVLLVHEDNGVVVGSILGTVLSSYFSNDLILQEMAVYSRKSYGLLRLLDAFENEAKLRGIKKIVLGCKPDFFDMTKIIKHKKYKLLETQFLKEI